MPEFVFRTNSRPDELEAHITTLRLTSQRLSDTVEGKRSQLQRIVDEIKTAEEGKHSKLARLQDDLKRRTKELEKEFEEKNQTLYSDITGLTTSRDNLKAEINTLAEERDSLKSDSEEIAASRQRDLDRIGKNVSEKRSQLGSIETSIADQQVELDRINNNVEEVSKKQTHVENLLMEGETAYSSRQEELNGVLSDLEQKINRKKLELTRYETAMQDARKNDEDKENDLQRRERGLAAKTRALNQEKQDFVTEKKRFYKTRGLYA